MTTHWNWLEFLERAVREEPSESEACRARVLADKWPTCACGDLCKSLPRYHDGCPIDNALAVLGIGFRNLVVKGDWENALSTFHAIESRTDELLAQQKGEI